ncbi:MAG: CDP-diacylglycerol--glycerol-3-phosphate 3-phosphatidyltransferase [Planctomycetaceae bacterium]|nr:MAG: CDP-diacylglycerol--glycerol-3-phosphate 3-phosphatidyltransferase [Planctomycetaceae bacterium]
MIQDPPAKSIWNIPNALTALRFVLAIVVFVLIPLQWFFAAFVVFVIAASTDWIDGYWARRFGQTTQLGRIFDPFVDKIIICGAFIFLAAESGSGIVAWMAVVVVAREMLVTALRGFIEQHGGDFSAKMSGKLKMVFQCIAAGASLLVLSYADAPPPDWMAGTLVVSVWLAVLSTIYSGLEYVVVALRSLQQAG